MKNRFINRILDFITGIIMIMGTVLCAIVAIRTETLIGYVFTAISVFTMFTLPKRLMKYKDGCLRHILDDYRYSTIHQKKIKNMFYIAMVIMYMWYFIQFAVHLFNGPASIIAGIVYIMVSMVNAFNLAGYYAICEKVYRKIFKK